MRTKTSVLISVMLALCPTSAFACREVPADQAYAMSDTVLVGYVSSISIPGLAHLEGPVDDGRAFAHLVDGMRVVRVVVSETRKGTADPVEVMEVTRCHGFFVKPGEKVVAFHFRGGYWRLDGVTYQQLTPSPSTHLPPAGHPAGSSTRASGSLRDSSAD